MPYHHAEMPGRGREHGDESLPPTIRSLQTVAALIRTWVTAEYLVGSLSELEAQHTSSISTSKPPRLRD